MSHPFNQWERALARTLLHSLWEGAAVALGLALVLFFVRSSRARYAASAVAMLALAGGLVVTFTHFARERPIGVQMSAGATLQVAAPGITDRRATLPARGERDFYFNSDYLSWVVPVWLAGVLIFYVRGIAGWWAAWRLRLVILIPVGLLAGMPAEQVEAILLHELAHIRRYDYVVNLLQAYLEGLLFYHPAVWWISGVMRAERENCCDDVAVRATGGAFEYAKALAVLEARREFPRVALAATGGGLVRRIQRLLGRPERRFGSAIPLVTAVGLALCVATAMVGWQAQPVAPPVAAPAAEVPEPAPAPAAPPANLPDHKILPNDLLSISVYDEPELSRSVRVDEDGKIAVPQVTEKLQAGGLMPRDIEKEISSALVDGQILLHPIVAVSIVEYAERHISVVGDVKMPGQFTITIPISLLEALAKAGWVTEGAGPDVLLTTPDSPTPRKINLRDLQMSTDRSLNVMLTGGEVVNVPDAIKELAASFPKGPKIWITGNVVHPMVYSIFDPADATVLKVVASAGGVTQNYAKTAWIYRRLSPGIQSEIPIPLGEIMHHKAPDVALQADDVLLVPDSDTIKMQQYYDTHPLLPPWEIAK